MRVLFGFLIFLLVFSSFAFAQETITFSDHMRNLNTLNLSSSKLAKISLLKKLFSIKDEKCEYDIVGNNYIFSPVCLIKKELPNIPYKTLINKIWSDLDGFDLVYNDSSQNFSYESAKPLFEGYKSFMPKTDRHKYLLASLQEQGKKISIPSQYVYYEKAKDLGFFVVAKDTSLLKPCTKQNYNVALASLDNFTLGAGKTFNLNQHIAYLPGYCKGTGPKNLMFYGGVCGFASQLFRTSLINPDVEIVKRYGHSVWLTSYYGDYLYGDDAAIYQNNKQLEIKNNSDYEIYFKVLDKGKYNYFVAISPQRPSKKVDISKTQVSKLSSKLVKTVYDIDSREHLANQVFDSVYSYKSAAIR